jgi:hypothetical protein
MHDGASRTVRINLMEGSVMLGICFGGFLGSCCAVVMKSSLISVAGGFFVSDIGYGLSLLIPVSHR